MKRFFIFCFFVLFFISFVSSLSNESSNYSLLVLSAKEAVDEVYSKGLSIDRINESYSECLQFYLIQVDLENSGKKADYGLVNKYCNEVSTIKDLELESTDELLVFLSEYNAMNQSLNLSSMDDVYNNILSSYSNERFEDTLQLIPLGYESLTSIQSSQTALNLFYESTSSNIKNFFLTNWKPALIFFSFVLAVWIIFNKRIRRWHLRRKIASLEVRKDTIKRLMERLQKEYFENKKISENEYSVKMKSFSEMTLDISRQILLHKEELSKLNFSSKN